MYQVKKADTHEEREIVIKTMGDNGQWNADHVWGFWDGDVCIGGVNLFNLNNFMAIENISTAITVPPSFSLGLIGYIALVEATKIKKRLIAKIAIDNLVSRKTTKQFGFRKIYTKGRYEFMELINISDILHKRWGKNVQSNS